MAENIKQLAIADAFDEYFTTYGASVLYSRAIPSVEDGWTPVNRRILYTMNEMNESGFKKGAFYNGVIMSRYHPHGDLSLWDTTVSLSQWWKNQFVFITAQGNNGTLGGKSPAAMRYLELKLSSFSKEAFFEDIDKNITDIEDNYDKTMKIAKVLPSKFPTILNTGVMGIASGYATDIPVHSVSDICKTTLAYMADVTLDSKALAKVLQGPDFSTGGDIVNFSELPAVYEKGQGVVRVRGHIVERTVNGKDVIVITAIPPKQTVGGIVEEITNLCKDVEERGSKKKVPGPLQEFIADIKDFSSKDVVEVVITPKRDVAPSVLRNMIFDMTNMTYSHKYIMNVLVGGEFVPNASLQFIIEEWLKFRMRTIRRKFVYLVGKTLERVTILSALIKASKNIDAIIALIRKSASKEDSMEILIKKYDFAEKEAKYIVEQQLYKLSNIETDKLKEELAEKQGVVNEYIQILGDEEHLRNIIREDLEGLIAKYGKTKRKTALLDVSKINHIDLVEQEDLLINITTDNYIYSSPVSEMRDSNRGNKGFLIIDSKRDKIIERSVVLNSHDELFLFTDKGKMFILHGYQLDVKHVHISNLIPELNGQKIAAFVPVRQGAVGTLIFTTSNSFTKRCDLAEYQTRNFPAAGLIAVALNDGETVVGVEFSTSDDDIIVITTARGFAQKIPVKNLPTVKRTTKGRRLIRLKEGDECASLVLTDGAEDKTLVLFITTKGKGKMVPLEGLLYKKTETGLSAAFLAIKLNAEDRLLRSVVIRENEQVVITTLNGKSIKIESDQVHTYGRAAKGGKIISLNADDEVAAITVV